LEKLSLLGVSEDVQRGHRKKIKQLILDMPVRWSSTYGMLHHAVTLREVSRKAVFFQ
jgi:hypothetical protein